MSAVLRRRMRKSINGSRVRLRLSLDAAMKAGAEDIIVMMHFPPVNEKREPSAFTEILGRISGETGGLWAPSRSSKPQVQLCQGERDGILYEPVAADSSGFLYQNGFCNKKSDYEIVN